MLCASFVEIDPCSSSIILYVKILKKCLNYLTLEKGGTLHLNKLEFPSPMDALCQVIEIGQVVLKT